MLLKKDFEGGLCAIMIREKPKTENMDSRNCLPREKSCTLIVVHRLFQQHRFKTRCYRIATLTAGSPQSADIREAALYRAIDRRAFLAVMRRRCFAPSKGVEDRPHLHMRPHRGDEPQRHCSSRISEGNSLWPSSGPLDHKSRDTKQAALIYRFAAKSMAKSLPSLGRHVRIPV
jgi:hypothetical protein